MLQAILQKAASVSRQLKNFFTVIDAKSMAEFLKFVRKEKNPKIYISLCWSIYDKPGSDSRSCDVIFTAFMDDRKTVVLKLREDIKIFGSVVRDGKKTKQYVNWRLLNDSVKPPVQIMVALMPSATIEVRDLYGKPVNPVELKKELF